MATAKCLEGLEPKRIFEVFSELCEIPHGSKNEKAISDYIYAFCRKLGLETYQDETNNLIIRKPATPGYENVPSVVLQAHLDMVCEKNADIVHDFKKDPIHILRDGDRIYADGTTLGADNATGLAFAMCVLESNDIPHPALEVVFTADEEAGMSGIKALDFSRIKGRVILNLDCSDEGIVVGCAGSSVIRMKLKAKREVLRESMSCVKLKIRGLKGGHSGLDITKERGNANVIITRILADAESELGALLCWIAGGLQTNAICREAEAVVAIDVEKKDAWKALVERWERMLKKELKISDPEIAVLFEETETSPDCFNSEGTEKVLDFLMNIESGLVSMNMEVPGVAETSGNVGTISTEEDTITVRVNYRSCLESKKRYMVEKNKRLAKVFGADFSVESDSPEWEYKADNRLSSLIQEIFEKRYGKKMVVEVSHGGNECGTFFKHFPDADIVCSGTQIVGAHTPKESVMVSTIQKEWEMLCLTLKGMLEY